eukprot:GHUV01007957.1.p1 GENE.GHUV01007957.1~~GHUV01007957.1.p1  ORF type:complete len:106 (+),score=15.06 GHUV01007957.1:424-741(+)
MGGSSSKLTPADEQRLGKKCKTLSTTYQKCHKANPTKPSACSNLETSLVMCYAGDLCKDAYAAHEKCYMSLMNTGYYQGKRDCDETVNAMKMCLKKYELYPFDIK